MLAKIRQRYDELRRKGVYSVLYRPTNIHFVRFAAQCGGRQTGIYETPLAIPPATEVDEKRYHYHICPLDPLPPIDRRTFFHYFWTHASHPPTTGNPARDMLFYNRLPKKLNTSMLQETDPKKIYGWGVHIIEGPNKPLIAWCVTGILIVSFMVAVLYDVLRKSSDSGFSIGQWIVAVLSTALRAMYFHLEDIA
ncbi:hypothetical protein LTR85_000203 [Meristemomyces frigidus]|nr:hypothetical protein LTR85_000203 [Meristemomyces frigidus]